MSNNSLCVNLIKRHRHTKRTEFPYKKGSNLFIRNFLVYRKESNQHERFPNYEAVEGRAIKLRTNFPSWDTAYILHFLTSSKKVTPVKAALAWISQPLFGSCPGSHGPERGWEFRLKAHVRPHGCAGRRSKINYARWLGKNKYSNMSKCPNRNGEHENRIVICW